METSPKQDVFYSSHSAVKNNPALCDSLINYARQYLNKPYCYGSNVPKCFDCSGFVQYVFSHFGSKLPNSSGNIAYYGKFISFKNASAGDLIFFNGRSTGETVGHVGIVTKIEGNAIYFIHASVQAGVIVSNTLESYYSNRLMFVKRVRL
jgi:cell wall-associated NlpC family hydrolase